MKIAVEYIKWLAEEQARINQKDLNDIEFFENGMKVEINPEIIKQFKFVGLLNTDFILSRYYLKEKGS